MLRNVKEYIVYVMTRDIKGQRSNRTFVWAPTYSHVDGYLSEPFNEK